MTPLEMKGDMRKYNQSSRGKRPVNVTFRVGGENTCSPCNDVASYNASRGSLKECDSGEQWKEISQRFQAMTEKLRKETSMLHGDLRRHANYCVQLKRENKLLLDELRHLCEPDVISILEAKNPDPCPQSVDDGQTEYQSRGSITECNSSPDHSADGLNFKPDMETSF